MFYVEQKLSRWATQAVAYKTLDQAIRAASFGGDCDHIIVWDCSASPVGAEVARFSGAGKRIGAQ